MKVIWISFVVIVLTILAVVDYNKYSSYKVINDSSINKAIKIMGNRITINLRLLKEANTTSYQEFVNNPLPCNTTKKYNGFIVPLKTTIQTTNKDCFRAIREYSLKKLPNTTRIVLIGDSFAYGEGVNDNETLSSYLESMNKNLEVLNLGVPGYNTKLEVQRLIKKGLKYHPDIVLLSYVSNDFEDCRIVRTLDTYLFEALTKKNLSWEEVWEVIGRFNYLKYFPFNSTFPDSVEKPFYELYNLSQKYNFSVIVISYPLKYYLDEKDYVARLEKLCNKYNFSFYYLPKVIGYSDKGKWVLSHKDTHPTPYANKKTAEFLTRILQKQYKLN